MINYKKKKSICVFPIQRFPSCLTLMKLDLQYFIHPVCISLVSSPPDGIFRRWFFSSGRVSAFRFSHLNQRKVNRTGSNHGRTSSQQIHTSSLSVCGCSKLCCVFYLSSVHFKIRILKWLFYDTGFKASGGRNG